MAKKKPAAKAKEESGEEKLSFEKALQKLQEIVQQLEDGQLGLQQALEAYERGIKYLRFCYKQLDQAERKIELLTVDQDGNLHTESFDEDEQASLEEKQKNRSRRRSRPPRASPPQADDDSPTLF